MERLHVADQMIRRQHEHHRVGIRALQRERGDRDRRRGVASDRLEDLRARRRVDRAQLLGDEEAVLVVAHDGRRLGAGEPAEPLDRLLQHRPLGDERQELLRQQLPRHRPEPAAGAAAEHDRIELRCHARILTAVACGFAPRIARLRDRRPPLWTHPESSSPARPGSSGAPSSAGCSRRADGACRGPADVRRAAGGVERVAVEDIGPDTDWRGGARRGRRGRASGRARARAARVVGRRARRSTVR